MDSHSIKKLLQNFDIFSSLSDYEIEPIIDLAYEKTYDRGAHVFMHGDKITDIYFILDGNIKIYNTDVEGNEQIVNVLKTGDFFPHQGFYRQDNYPAHAQALKNSILISIDLESFEELIITHPGISTKLFRILGNFIADLQIRLQERILHNTYTQIIMLLLRLANSHGIEEDVHLIRISTKFTNKELANMIGSSRETVNRTLARLKDEQLIFTDTGGYLVLNIDELDEKISLQQ